MSLLVTGGTGFVMSNLARHWLERHADEQAVLVDLAPPDRVAKRFFAPYDSYVQPSPDLQQSWLATAVAVAAGVAAVATTAPGAAAVAAA